MLLSQLTEQLGAHPDAALAFVIPDGSAVAQHFHVTEVGRVRKDFIDCGGTPRSTDTCVLQVWVANDTDHRLVAGKLGKIIALGKGILQDADLPVEIEYDVGVITQFAVESFEATDALITLKLAGKHTACLAPDLCGIDGEGSTDAGCCSPSKTASGCCTPSDPGRDPGAISLGINQDKCC